MPVTWKAFWLSGWQRSVGSVTFAGSSSLAGTAAEPHPLTVTLAGSSSLAATVTELHRQTVTLAGASSLTATATEYQRIAVTLAGTSTLIQAPDLIPVTLAGTSTITFRILSRPIVHPVLISGPCPDQGLGSDEQFAAIPWSW